MFLSLNIRYRTNLSSEGVFAHRFVKQINQVLEDLRTVVVQFLRGILHYKVKSIYFILDMSVLNFVKS